MAAQVGHLPAVRQSSGPAPVTAEQKYWRAFKNQLLIPSPTSYPVTHITHTGGADVFAVTTGTRVQLYSTRTRKLVKTIARFSDVARSGHVRADGRIVAAADDSGLLQIFDASSRSILRSWAKIHRQPVWAFRFSPSSPTTLLSASDDRTVRLWDLTAPDPLLTLHGHADYVRSAAFMPAAAAAGPGGASAAVVSGSYDATVKLWDARVGTSASACVMTFKHADPIETVLPMPSGTTLLAAAGNAVSVLDLVAARPLHMITNHQKTVTALSLASGGRRLVTGGLDGHVKVFETTGWNVVSSRKYQSPVLSLAVIGGPGARAADTPTTTTTTTAGAAGDATPDTEASDRHLVVGLQSGLLSIQTRLTGEAAAREREREREMAALLAGQGDALEARKKKRKRRLDNERALEHAGDSVAAVEIANERSAAHRTRERPWERDLRHGHYARALDAVLDRAAPDHAPANILALLLALRHRSAMRDALEGRDEAAVLPVVHWVGNNIGDPRYLSVCVEAGLHLLDLYSEHVGGSAELHGEFKTLHRRVKLESDRAQVACQTNGMLESLITNSITAPVV